MTQSVYRREGAILRLFCVVCFLGDSVEPVDALDFGRSNSLKSFRRL